VNIDLNETQTIIDAAKEQVYLQGKTHEGNRAKPRRGQVFHCHLGVGVGSEFQKRRPCVILSNTVSNINTSVVVVAPITHTQKSYPVFVPIAEKYGADGAVILSGCADLCNIRAISSYRLAGLICELDNEEMKRIDAAAARHLDLMRHYNAVVKAKEDREKHVDALAGILSKLRAMTGADSNQTLIEAVEKLIAENGKNGKK
jgi:mRNA interferase MazF